HPNGALWAYGLAAAGAWLGELPADSALGLRDAALRSDRGRPPDGAAEVAWLDGLLACTRADDAALARARETLAASRAGGARARRRSAGRSQQSRPHAPAATMVRHGHSRRSKSRTRTARGRSASVPATRS